MAEETKPLECTMYIFPFSLYSIMARFTAVLGAMTGESTKIIKNRLVNLHGDENIEEWYLLSVNPKGQVPAMTVGGVSTPIADSLDISYWFCDVYPGLLPEKHRSLIRNILGELHSIEGMSLSAPRPEQPEVDNEDPAVDTLLAKTNISSEYRYALEYKNSIDHGHLLKALYHETIAQAEDQARSLFDHAVTEYDSWHDEGPWFFGSGIGPTVLDAHLVPFITRLVEAGRKGLVPEELLNYAQRIVDSPQWDQVTHGRRTLWDVSYGHVHLLTDI
ncbi:hypothetical protein BJ170DRAFT_617442 [Xylariales sp. AK1849]|nr:hypothetical protein BJ170DRAFT_617442 [Xylariales sp. AK1849]